MDEIDEPGFNCLKIRMINPKIPTDTLEDMIFKKMEPFHQFTVKIVYNCNVGRSAYLNFKHKEDAEAAYERHAKIVLFDDEYQVVPITKKPLSQRAVRGSSRLKHNSPPASGSKYDTASDDDGETIRKTGRSSTPPRVREYRSGFRTGRPVRPLYPSSKRRGYGHRTSLSLHEESKSVYTEPVFTDMKEVSEHAPNRNLYIGYLDESVTKIELLDIFSKYGVVQDVELKNKGKYNYAFVRYFNLYMAQEAKSQMIGRYVGKSKPRFGYGDITPTRCIWVGDIGPWTSVEKLRSLFSDFGEVDRVVWPDDRTYAYVEFFDISDASRALKDLNGAMHGRKALLLDMVDVGLIDSMLNCDIRTSPIVPRSHRLSVGKYPSSRPPNRRIGRSSRGSRSGDRQSPLNRRRRTPERRNYMDHVDSGGSDRGSRNSPSPRRKRGTRSRSARSRSNSAPRTRRRRYSSSNSQSSTSSTSVKSDLTQPRDERTVVLKKPGESVTGYSVASAAPIIPSHYTPMPMYPQHVDTPVVHVYPPVLPNPTYPPPPLPPTDLYRSPTCPPPVFAAPYVPPAVQRFAPAATVQPPFYQPEQQLYGEIPCTSSNATHKIDKARESKVINFPKVWSGALVLKNSAFVVNLHLVSGSVVLVNSLLGSTASGASADCPVLKIAQRLRLDLPEKLDELDRRLRQAGRGACSLLLASSAEAEVDDASNVIQQRPLQSLVTYLSQKEVAAVVPLSSSCTATPKGTGVLHAFPPCAFARKFLEREVPGIDADCPAEDQLLVVVCEQ